MFQAPFFWKQIDSESIYVRDHAVVIIEKLN